MRYRVNYEILGHMAFLSHLEMMRLWQRALLRSSLPVAWSQGFNPRPKLSLGPAKGVGVEGLSEYLDVDFKTYLQGDEVISKLKMCIRDRLRLLLKIKQYTRAYPWKKRLCVHTPMVTF